MNNDYIEFLVKSAQSGRKNAFMEMSDFFLKKIFILSYFLTADLNISKVLTKRIFIKSWEKLKEYNNDNLFSEWFYELAVELIYDELKTKYIASYLIEKNENSENNNFDDKLNIIEKAILDLSQDDRFIFVLHDIEKFSIQKINDILEKDDIEKQETHLFEVRDEILRKLNIVDEDSHYKLLGKYKDIIGAKSSDEQAEKIETLNLSKEKHYELIYFFTTISSFQPDLLLPEDIRESIFNELFKQGLEEKSKQRKEEELKQIAKQKFQKDVPTVKDKSQKIKIPKATPPPKMGREKPNINFKLPKIAGKNILLLGFFSIIIICVVYYFTFFQMNTPWSVQPLEGRYSITNTSDLTKLYEKQVIMSDKSSSALIRIPDIGTIKIEESSEVTLNKGTKASSEVILNKGSIELTSGAEKSGLVIDCGQIRITDMGSIAMISFRPPGDCRVEVARGFTEVKLYDDFVYVIRNHICETKLGAKPGVPYNKSAAPELVQELRKLQYQNGGFESLTKIINAAKASDAITLWHLYPRVEVTERELIYTKMIEFFPMPEGMVRRDAINLKQDKLNEWFDDIKWQL